MNDLSWHVIRTTAGREHATALLLRAKGIETFCPMQILASLVRGQIKEQTRALFLTYIFAYWDSDDAAQWHVIMNTTGVIEILGGGEPVSIEPGVVESWIERANDEAIIEDLTKTIADIKRGYKLDDEVKISGGNNILTGTVAWINDAKQTVGVKVSILGRVVVIVRRTTDCELHALAPGIPMRRRGYTRGGRRGHHARLKAISKQLRQNIPD